MAEVFAYVFVFALLAVFVWLAVGLVSPRAAARVPGAGWATSRGRVLGAGLPLAFLLLLVAGALAPEPTPEQLAAEQAIRDARDSTARAATAARDSTRAAEAALVARQDSAGQAQRAALMRIDFRRYYDEIIRAAGRSDPAANRMQEALAAGDVFAAYQAAERLETASREAWRAIDAVDIPASIPDSLRRDVREAQRAVSDALVLRRQAAADIKRALDGGGLSGLSRAQQSSEAYQRQLLVGTVSLLSVGFRIDSTFATHASGD